MHASTHRCRVRVTRTRHDAIRSRAHRAMSLLRIRMGSCTRAFMPVIKTRSFSPPGVLLPAQKGGHKPSVRVAGEGALRHRLLCLCAVLLATSRCAQPGTCDATWNTDSGRQQQRCAHAARPWGPRRHRASSPRGHRLKEDGLCSVTNSRTDQDRIGEGGARGATRGTPGEGVRRTKSRPGSQHFPCYTPQYNNHAVRHNTTIKQLDCCIVPAPIGVSDIIG